MTTLSFASQVSDWVKEAEGAVEAVWKQASQELVNTAQTPRSAGGRMRVDTGFLRASLMASTAAIPPINPTAKPVAGSFYAYPEQEVNAVIASAEIGQTLHFGWTASYAAYREYGALGQAPDAFVRTAAQRWPSIVEQVENNLAARLGA